MLPSAEKQLADLLLSLFSADELRRFLRYGPDGDAIERALPGANASASAIAGEAVNALSSRGRVDKGFFLRLLDERRGRRLDIERVQGLFADSSAESAPVEQSSSNAASEAPERRLNRPAKVFISYSHEDEAHRAELGKHLKMLQRQEIISVWHDRQILAGEEWKGAIDRHLEEADIILLLVSPDFLASDYCWDVETKRAMQRHDAGAARVIPIFVRTCDWTGAPFGKLQGVPDPKVPVDLATSRDVAWTAVARAVRQIVDPK